MSIVTLERVSRTYADDPVFSDVSFGIEAGEHVGLIGANGSGKSTLLRLVCGLDQPDAGRVYYTGSPVIGMLSQNAAFDPEATVLDTIFAASNETMRLVHDYERVCARLAAGDGDHDTLLAEMTDLSAHMESSAAWSLETEAKIILDRLGISDTSAPMGSLSGGQRKRVALAHALLERPDLLNLDEPTNHLDADSVAWLEDYLRRHTAALLLVTHDRYFLDRVTARIVEVDRGRVRTYAGNYEYYLEKKEEEEERLAVEEHKRDMLVRQELEWLRRGPRARRTKQKARIDRAAELMGAPKTKKKEELDIALGSKRLGRKILELHDVSKAWGDNTVVRNFSHIVQPRERVGFIGPNGAGKTTLLEMIVGRISPDTGTIDVGETVSIGYYDQESRALADDMRVIDYVREAAETIRTADGGVATASQMLERFLFPPPMQYAVIGNLSGGERRRLYLLRLLMSAPNVLVLDEPTNDFDIATLQALESYLDGFDGCVIVVSHDRYFLDRTVDHLFRFEGDGVLREYPGNYSAYLDIREREEEAARDRAEQTARIPQPEAPQPDAPQPTADGDRPLSYKERRELETLEQSIEDAESRKAEIETRLATADYIEAADLAEALRELEESLELAMNRWAELAERAG